MNGSREGERHLGTSIIREGGGQVPKRREQDDGRKKEVVLMAPCLCALVIGHEVVGIITY